MKRFIYFLSIALIATACEKEDEFIGPSSCDQFCEFRVSEVLSHNQNDGVDFTNESVEFSAKFNNTANWKIIIEGQESGALKTFSGSGRTIDPSTTNWDGKADGKWFSDEECKVSLVVDNYPDTISSNLTIMHKYDYDGIGTVINSFKNLFGINAYGGVTADNTVDIDGNGSLHMEGTETGGLWWMGGMALSPQGSYFSTPTTSPDQLYFNVYVYGTGSATTKLTVTFLEDENEDGAFDKATEDGWEKPTIIDWVGWKLVSFPMSETTEMFENGHGNGNKSKEFDKIKMIEVQLFSNGTADPTPKSLNVDYAVFTANGPL